MCFLMIPDNFFMKLCRKVLQSIAIHMTLIEFYASELKICILSKKVKIVMTNLKVYLS